MLNMSSVLNAGARGENTCFGLLTSAMRVFVLVVGYMFLKNTSTFLKTSSLLVGTCFDHG